ncbi:hypothetical protein SEPCBS57363_004518 [Sporothrix epigloea]|uniref:Ankyrin repeat protein n=1 Tax=Sporothrix epigloea TaxID=1892477 RepID=A0ABP0DSG7_9PEZI
MAGLAKGQPQVHPNATLSGIPERLRPPAVATSRNPSSGLGLPVALPHAAQSLKNDKYLHLKLDEFIDQLGRIIKSICGLFQLQENAWGSLRLLYNSVFVLHKLYERLWNMLQNLSQIESVAKEINVYEPETPDKMHDTEDLNDLKNFSSYSSVQPRDKPAAWQSLTPAVWSSRVLPGIEQQLTELRTHVGELEPACRSVILGRQSKLTLDLTVAPKRWNEAYITNIVQTFKVHQLHLEMHMMSCKYVHMVSTKSLYASQQADYRIYRDKICFEAALNPLTDRAPALTAFLRGMDIATAAKWRREKVKKMLRKQKATHSSGEGKEHSAKTESPLGKSQNAPDDLKEKDMHHDKTHALDTNEILAATIDRKDYLTAITMLMSDLPLNEMLEDGTFLLSHAIMDDNLALVSILVMCGADPDVRHRNGSNLLHCASFFNSVSSTMLLLELGVDVDARDGNGLTPLHLACREHHISIMLQLLTHGADPNICDCQGRTPLAYALLLQNRVTFTRSMISVLLTYGARATGRGLSLQPLFEFILCCNTEKMCAFLKKFPSMADSEMPVATHGGQGNANTAHIRPLYAAIMIGNGFALDRLLHLGADVNHRTMVNGRNMTYLSQAVLTCSLPFVSRLLLQNSDPNLADNQGITALLLASSFQRGNLELVKLLLRHGADPLAATYDRHCQPLHAAVHAGRADNCDLLLKGGALIDQPMRTGITPLMLAASCNNTNMARFLISRGADAHFATPIYGETAMHWASMAGSLIVAATLLGVGLSVNAKVPFPRIKQPTPSETTDGATSRSGREGASAATSQEHNVGSSVVSNASVVEANPAACGYAPIHAAASHGRTEIVRWLLANGADPGARIGRKAASQCLGRDRTFGKEKIGAPSEIVLGDPVTNASNSDSNEDEINDFDPGKTAAEIARNFGHDETAAVIEDAILAASPAIRKHLVRPLPPPNTSAPSSSS